MGSGGGAAVLTPSEQSECVHACEALGLSPSHMSLASHPLLPAAPPPLLPSQSLAASWVDLTLGTCTGARGCARLSAAAASCAGAQQPLSLLHAPTPCAHPCAQPLVQECHYRQAPAWRQGAQGDEDGHDHLRRRIRCAYEYGMLVEEELQHKRPSPLIPISLSSAFLCRAVSSSVPTRARRRARWCVSAVRAREALHRLQPQEQAGALHAGSHPPAPALPLPSPFCRSVTRTARRSITSRPTFTAAALARPPTRRT